MILDLKLQLATLPETWLRRTMSQGSESLKLRHAPFKWILVIRACSYTWILVLFQVKEHALKDQDPLKGPSRSFSGWLYCGMLLYPSHGLEVFTVYIIDFKIKLNLFFNILIKSTHF